MFTADEVLFVSFDNDRDFRVANVVLKLAQKTGELFASHTTIGEMCWPREPNALTKRNRAAKSIKKMVDMGLLKATGKKYGNGAVSYRLDLTCFELTSGANLTQDELTHSDNITQNELPPNSGGVTTELSRSYHLTQNELQYRDLRKDLREEEEKKAHSSSFFQKQEPQGPQKPKAASPSKHILTSDEIDHLRKLCRQIYDLREDPQKRRLEDMLQIGCDRFGYEGLVELIRCMRHDTLIMSSPEHRTLAYAYNTHQKVLEVGRAAFEAERIRRQQFDEKMAQEAAERAREQEYLQSDEYKRSMEKTRAFIQKTLRTTQWYMEDKKEAT